MDNANEASSNQKYREFEDKFSDVGLITGDVANNPSDPDGLRMCVIDFGLEIWMVELLELDRWQVQLEFAHNRYTEDSYAHLLSIAHY